MSTRLRSIGAGVGAGTRLACVGAGTTGADMRRPKERTRRAPSCPRAHEVGTPRRQRTGCWVQHAHRRRGRDARLTQPLCARRREGSRRLRSPSALAPRFLPRCRAHAGAKSLRNAESGLDGRSVWAAEYVAGRVREGQTRCTKDKSSADGKRSRPTWNGPLNYVLPSNAFHFSRSPFSASFTVKDGVTLCFCHAPFLHPSAAPFLSLRLSPRRACERMRWLDGCTVLLDPNAEASADYAGCKHPPPPPGFGLARPYAAAAREHQTADDIDDGGQAREGEESAAPGAVDEPRRRRKKRRRRESDAAAALRAQRGDEAER